MTVLSPMSSRTQTTEEAPSRTDGSRAPRDEVLAVAAKAFRQNLDDYQNLGYHYVVLRGDRLVSAGPTAEAAWAQAAQRGIDAEEAFCASVTDGCVVHPF